MTELERINNEIDNINKLLESLDVVTWYDRKR